MSPAAKKTAVKTDRIVDDTPLECADAAALLRWYKKHHASHAGVWLRIAKKASGIASVDHPEALEIALCFGWIDGQRKSQDAQFFLQRFQRRLVRRLGQLAIHLNAMMRLGHIAVRQRGGRF